MELKQLAKEQRKAFDIIEGSMDNVFVQGKPGTGKSFLIKALTELGNKHYTLAAPTGLAALNISSAHALARTLHSLFRIPVSDGIFTRDFNNFTMDDRVINNLKYNVKHIIMDEGSMIRCDQFDFIDRFMRFVKGYHQLPFGGVQLILVGDLYQLPPVVKGYDSQQLKEEGYDSPFVFSAKVFPGTFKVVELKEVHRQKGDPKFLDILDSARTGDVTPKQAGLLNKQVDSDPKDLRIKLAGINKQAEEINMRELSKLPGEAKKYIAVKYGEWPALPCEEILSLKVGAQVMVKQNAADRPPNFEGKYESTIVNGTLGKVVEMLMATKASELEPGQPSRVIIELENQERVTIFSQRWERKIKEKVGDRWEERVVATFEQIPLALAWAISIHKSQGQSFEKVHIDASKIFADGQLYVAISRCRSLKGLSFQAPINTRKFRANSRVLEFFENQ